jgi:hypothetical protein
MTKRVYPLLESFARFLFFLLLLLNLLNWITAVTSEIIIRKLPFQVSSNGYASDTKGQIEAELQDKFIISIDSLQIGSLTESEERDFVNPLERNEMQYNPFRKGILGIGGSSDLQQKLSDYVKDKKEVMINYLDPVDQEESSVTVATVKALNKSRFLILIFNIVFMFFIFFNTNLILNFSRSRENYIIVYFFLFMAFPDKIPFLDISQFTMFMITPFLGILFYHYARKKVPGNGSALYLYIITFIGALLFYLLFILYMLDLSPVLIIWSIFWFLYSFRILHRSLKISQSIEIKRLINAFRGILVSLICLVAVGILLFLGYILSGGTSLQITGLTTIVLVSCIILAGFGFLLGILWFFGSFTWGLLTGTVLDVKIRSTLIFTIVGVLFVTAFGLVDYTLGELLQTLFGNFIGSEFIAGIPATIGLLVFFNPIRNKVETLVDSKLNTSDLDFLERADTFSENLTEDGVIEGFEEYICENLIHRLPIKKVALISYQKESGAFIFNEIRGSEVIENSLVEDIHSILEKDEIYKSYVVNENEQDVSSFSLLLPIIYEEDYKWFLALGRKIDGSVYSRKDEISLVNLTNKIKLSLKFILAYDEIVTNKYLGKLKEKNKLLKKYEKEIEQLKIKLDQVGKIED